MTPRDSSAHCQHQWMTLGSRNEHIKIPRITGLSFELEVNYKLPIAATSSSNRGNRVARCSDAHATYTKLLNAGILRLASKTV